MAHLKKVMRSIEVVDDQFECTSRIWKLIYNALNETLKVGNNKKIILGGF